MFQFFAPCSFFCLCARQQTPARQVLIMIPVTEKVFGKEGEHVHDPVCFFLFAHAETPHHRSESSLSEATVSWEFVSGMDLVGLRSNHAARARSHELRSFLALEMAARKVLPPVRLASLGSTLLRACDARDIYIYIYIHTYMCVFFSAQVFRRASNVISQIWKSIFHKFGNPCYQSL